MSNIKKKRRKIDGFSVITANSLLTGDVYWLTSELTWSQGFDCAYPFPNTSLEDILQNECHKLSNKSLVNITEEPVRKEKNMLVPLTMKGSIRAFGPNSQH